VSRQVNSMLRVISSKKPKYHHDHEGLGRDYTVKSRRALLLRK